MPSLTKEQHQIFVENLYRVILEREPDQQGLANHVNFLDNVGFEQGVKTLLSAFIQSEEYKNKLIKNSDDEIKQKFLNDFVWTQKQGYACCILAMALVRQCFESTSFCDSNFLDTVTLCPQTREAVRTLR